MLFRYLSAVLAGGHIAAVFGASANAEGHLQKRQLPDTHVLHERQPDHWVSKWDKRQKAPRDTVLPMRVGLRQRNLRDGHEKLMEISNPNSPSYGKHLSAEEVIEFFAPPSSQVESVMNWLVEGGISKDRLSHSVNKQWVQFDASVEEVEGILYADYFVFEHIETGSLEVACDQYHIPSHITEHIDYITPGIRLRPRNPEPGSNQERSPSSKSSKRRVKASNTGFTLLPDSFQRQSSDGDTQYNSSMCDQIVTPVCIRNQYRLPKGTTATQGNELGIFSALNQHYSPRDLDTYWTNVYPEIPRGTYPKEDNINGAIGAGMTLDQLGTEAALDVQAVWPLIWPQKVVMYQNDDQYIERSQTEANSPYKGFYNTFFDAIDGSYCTYSAFGETGDCKVEECLDPSYPDSYGYQGTTMCGVYEATNVISISYGGAEADYPPYYVQRQCSEAMKLAMQGTTIVTSSGDDGVASFPGDPNPTGCEGEDSTIFNPSFLATCPYVLAVGSTELDAYTTSNAPKCKWNEVATTQFPSGGGFSNVFPRADYQASAVQGYFDTVEIPFPGYSNTTDLSSNPGSGVYNISGRGYPDVSAVGANYLIVFAQSFGLIGGTSLSAPIWASIVTRINEERLAVNKSPVGFINPTLYAHPEVFSDITVGSNPGCGTPGFSAAPGWDPVTGLGSPNYAALLKIFLSLP
ncbi:alkaline serine protease [Thozetella sp. PMI_491]|nr:alkaline serine protease [Thozetella sp. PMI_491]